MLDFIGLLFSLGLLVLCIYILSRVFHFFNDTKLMLAEIEKKLDEIQKVLSRCHSFACYTRSRFPPASIMFLQVGGQTV